MSPGNLEVFGRMVDAWNGRDVDAFMADCDPDIELVFPADVPEPGPFRGAAEVRAWIEGFLGAWKSHRVEPEQLVERGEEVAALLRLSGRGAISDIALDELRPQVYSFRHGRVVRWVNHSTWTEALEAVDAGR